MIFLNNYVRKARSKKSERKRKARPGQDKKHICGMEMAEKKMKENKHANTQIKCIRPVSILFKLLFIIFFVSFIAL